MPTPGKFKCYVGSCADDSIGIGTIIVGSDVALKNGSPYIFDNGDLTWIEVYDVRGVTVDQGEPVIHDVDDVH